MAALLSAAFWAMGTVLWKRLENRISPLGMNLAKGVIGSLYLAVISFFIKIGPIDAQSVLFLVLSGLVGIALGDTFFFVSLKYLGARLSSLTGTLTPVAIALSALFFLRERPSFFVWVGILLTTGGVAWLLKERLPSDSGTIINKPLGVTYRLLSIICTAAGIILAKKGVANAPVIQATLIRLLSSVAGLFLWGCLNRQLSHCLGFFKNISLFKEVAFVVFIVVFGGFWLSLLALKYIDASVAGTLNATSPLFILPISAIMLKEKISRKAVLGTTVAVAGVALILLGG